MAGRRDELRDGWGGRLPFFGVAEGWPGDFLAGTPYVPPSDFFIKINGRTYPLVTDI